MADPRIFELDELLIRPGTYFNPQTEVLVVVDDSPDLDNDIFNMERYEGAEWVCISDEPAVDESARDEQIERFQVSYHPGSSSAVAADEDDHADETEDDDQEVGREDLDSDEDYGDEEEDEVEEL